MNAAEVASLIDWLTPAERRELDDLIALGPRPIWTPYPDSPQSRALVSHADITGFGGQAGGGKTDLILGMAGTQHRRSLVLRREYVQLKGMIARSWEIFGDHGKFNGQDLIWRALPGGRVVEFGAVAGPEDARKYQGRPRDLLALDEATHFLENQFWFLMGWLRTTIPGQRCRVLLTFNPPTDVAGRWVVGLFAPWLDRKHSDPAMPGELRWIARVGGKIVWRPDGEPFDLAGEVITPKSITFFPARLTDNPALAATGYGSQLQSLPEPLRSQLLYGDFDAGIEDDPWQVIPTAWVESSMRRWAESRPAVPMTCCGMDVAHGGSAKTVIAPRYGNHVGPLCKIEGRLTPDGKTAAAECVKVLESGAYVNVDAIGYGASAAERLRDKPPMGHGIAAYPINVADRSEHTDRSGKYRMVNVRAEMYWRLREALDPEGDQHLCLPPDPELLADLTAQNYEITTSGIRIEPKADITARLGRSPDCGEAVALSVLNPVPPAPGAGAVGGFRVPARGLPALY